VSLRAGGSRDTRRERAVLRVSLEYGRGRRGRLPGSPGRPTEEAVIAEDTVTPLFHVIQGAPGSEGVEVLGRRRVRLQIVDAVACLLRVADVESLRQRDAANKQIGAMDARFAVAPPEPMPLQRPGPEGSWKKAV
jgi:hypothetical protein